MDKINKTIMFPHPPAGGGPGSFQLRFEQALKSQGWDILYAGERQKTSLIMVIGGTRRIIWLLKMKLKGIPILFRLDGIAWLHRRKKVSLYIFLLAELRNLLTKFTHAFLADFIVYQSRFVESWWNMKGWRKRKRTKVIYNGVQDNTVEKQSEIKNKRLVILEGNIDYSPYAIQLLNDLAQILPKEILIEVYGSFECEQNKNLFDKRINYHGHLERGKVNNILTGSVYLSLDINPACPNTVIEALSCGTPVVAFDTGSLKELVDHESGIIVSYGSDPWKLAYPDVSALESAILRIFDDYSMYSQKAESRYKNHFTFNLVMNNYLQVFKSLVSF